MALDPPFAATVLQIKRESVLIKEADFRKWIYAGVALFVELSRFMVITFISEKQM